MISAWERPARKGRASVNVQGQETASEWIGADFSRENILLRGEVYALEWKDSELCGPGFDLHRDCVTDGIAVEKAGSIQMANRAQLYDEMLSAGLHFL